MAGSTGCCTSCGASFVPPTCGSCGATVDPATGRVVAQAGVCSPGPGNEPVSDAEYARSLGVCLQDSLDQARRLQHELGLRAYRVKLVWVKRDRRQRYSETLREVELVPVNISSFTGIGWQANFLGMDNDQGELVLTEISPAQVDFDDLQGKWEGEDPPHDVRFFYEIQQLQRCEGGPPIKPGRYTPASLPAYLADDFQWTIVLTSQIVHRGAEGTPDNRDQVFDDDPRRNDDGLRF